MDEIQERINDVIFEALQPRIRREEISGPCRIVEDLQAESVDFVQIYYGLMAEFDIQLASGDVGGLRTVDDIYRAIGALVQARGRGRSCLPRGWGPKQGVRGHPMKPSVAYHDALASAPDGQSGPSPAEIDLIWRALRLAPGARVLEIGCGAGRLLNELRPRGANVLGIEAAPRMAARARDQLGLQVREADVCTMELNDLDSAFDACVVMPDGILGASGEEDDLTILNRAVACTRPGGRILVAAPHVAHFMSEESFCPVRCAYSKSLAVGTDDEVSYRQRVYHRAELVQMLRWANAMVLEPELGPLGEPQTQPTHKNVVVVAERRAEGVVSPRPAAVRPRGNERQWYETFFEGMKSEYLSYGFTFGTKAESDMLVSLLRLGKDSRCLDVACGVGRHTLELAARGYKVTGIDLSRSMIEAARKAAKESKLDATFEVMDARDIPASGDYDAAWMVCEGAFSLLESDDANLAVLKAVRGALKPGGRFFMTALSLLRMLHAGAEVDLDTGVQRWSEEVPSNPGKPLEGANRAYLYPELVMLLRSAGFVATVPSTNICFGRSIVNLNDMELNVLATAP